jgi:signal transduction histidine kinase
MTTLDDLILKGKLLDNNNNHNNSKKIKLSYQPLDIFISADRTRLTQVILNLLNNAIKFTQEGVISIKAEVKNDNNNIVVSIKDTGTGIDAEIFPRLFTKFATKSVGSGGTGLGLFICKSIVEAHNGRIWAENNPGGRGATFAFSLPNII